MGVMSATFGGIMRDVLCAEVLTLMRPELYISCALLASLLYAIPVLLGLPQGLAALIAFFGGFALRGAAILCGLTLPRWSMERVNR